VAQAAGVRVVGLRELRVALGAVDRRFPEELRDESKDIARIVRLRAVQRLEADVGPGSTGQAASTIRAFATQRSAGVRAGNARTPYYGWLDFGGEIRHHGPNHSHSHAHIIRREFVARGRYLFPAADDATPAIAPKVERMIDRLFREAGFTD
jgi:hypothetical protein